MIKRNTWLSLWIAVILTTTLAPIGSAWTGQAHEHPATPDHQGTGTPASREQAVQTQDPPVPLPEDCDDVTPPGETPPACCLYGYIYYEDMPIDGASVQIESSHGASTVNTASGGVSVDPHYKVDLSSTPLLVSSGDVITITASYSDMVSARTWVVQSDGQHVDLGLVTGYQAPGPVSDLTPETLDTASLQASDWWATVQEGSRQSVMFIENVGQFPAPAGETDDDGARFQVFGAVGGKMWLTPDAIWITLLEPERWQGEENRETRQGVNLKLSFVDANPHPRLVPFNRPDIHVSYFMGDDPNRWQPNVPIWNGVRYLDLYPGIDLELKGENGQYTQRLIVQPDADLGAVRLRVEGAETIAVDAAGRLRLTTAAGTLTMPLLQLAGGEVMEPPVVMGNEVSRPLVPADTTSAAMPLDDPSDLLYSTFLGGSSDDHSFAIAVDGAGSAYVAGWTASSDFPTTPGAYEENYNGGSTDAFVVKLNADGTDLDYATFLGGSNEDNGYTIAVDGSGNAYVAGHTGGGFPTTPGAYDTSYNGGIDAFVVELNADGSDLAYATYLGGNDQECNYRGCSIAVDGTGSIYLTGDTLSSEFPTTAGAYDTSYNGGVDAFVVKLNPAGNGQSDLQYATFLGGSSDDCYGACGITVDGTGNAYVTGMTQSSDFPTTPGAYDASHSGFTDAFATKVNTDGTDLDYSTFLGGSGSGKGYAVAVDDAGCAYVTGETGSSDFATTPGAFDTSYNGADDAFVVKVNADGTDLDYATFLGGTGNDRGYGIAVVGGSAYVTGETESSGFPTTSEAYDTSHNGGFDAFVVKVNADGTDLDYATFLGGTSDECTYYDSSAIAVAGGSAYVTGDTGSSDFPTTVGAYDTSHNGGTDVFVSKLAIDLDAPLHLSINDVSVTEGNAGAVNAVFTVSLSATSGQQVTVDYATADGTATAGSDYQASSGTLTFPAGTTTQEVTVVVNGDTLDEGASETFFVNLSNPTNASIADDQGQGTIIDDDGEPSLSINDVSITEGDTGTVDAVFTMGLSATSGQQVTVDYAIADGTATAGSDYQASSGTLTFSPGTTTQDLTVVVNGDTLDEGASETFFVNLSNATNASIADDQGQGTITDDDGEPSLSINDVSVVEGTENAVFIVSLSATSGQQVRVNYATADGTAIAGSDYVATSGTLTFPAETTTQTITVQVNGDTFDEGASESFFVNLSNPTNATIADDQGEGTIIDDDNPEAAFAASPLAGVAPLTTGFTDQSAGAVVSWDWTFGDGGISGARHPAHEYTDSGTYTVSLTVAGPGGSDTETRTDYITVDFPSGEAVWAFLLYLDGDNNLHSWLQRALDNLEAATVNPDLTVLALLDGYGNGNTWRYHVQPGGEYTDGVNRWFMDELDMSDPQTLSDFVTWARDNYPADHYYLAVADHGRGTTGIAWDDASGSSQFITVAELRTALRDATTDGTELLDVVHYDACLMAMLEDAYQIKDYAPYLIASENLGWSIFAYHRYAAQVTAATTPEELAAAIVDEYHNALAGYPRTISALALGQAGTVEDAVTALSSALRVNLDANKYYVLNSRDAAQKFDSRDYFTINNDDEYLDLYDLARLLKQNVPDAGVQAAAQGVMDAVTAFVIAERHESGYYQDYPYWDLDDAHGVAIYFPPASSGWGYNDYMAHVFRFTAEGQWDEFLLDYFGLMGLPPETPTDPGLPPMLEERYSVYLPIIVR